MKNIKIAANGGSRISMELNKCLIPRELSLFDLSGSSLKHSISGQVFTQLKFKFIQNSLFLGVIVNWNTYILEEIYIHIFFFLKNASWKKSYNQSRKHIKKQRHTLLTKVHLVKAMGFPVVMYGYESWTIKKSEHQRIDAFELWCWRQLLRVPWTARRSNQSVLKEISPE